MFFVFDCLNVSTPNSYECVRKNISYLTNVTKQNSHHANSCKQKQTIASILREHLDTWANYGNTSGNGANMVKLCESLSAARLEVSVRLCATSFKTFGKLLPLPLQCFETQIQNEDIMICAYG